MIFLVIFFFFVCFIINFLELVLLLNLCKNNVGIGFLINCCCCILNVCVCCWLNIIVIIEFIIIVIVNNVVIIIKIFFIFLIFIYVFYISIKDVIKNVF